MPAPKCAARRWRHIRHSVRVGASLVAVEGVTFWGDMLKLWYFILPATVFAVRMWVLLRDMVRDQRRGKQDEDANEP